jgi:chaperonin GroEL (HSP60 family)
MIHLFQKKYSVNIKISFKIYFLGSSKRATFSEFETILTGTKGDKDEIKQRLNILKSKIKNEENKNLKEILKKRLSNLEGKTAIITVGGITESEVGENRDKIIDCLNSCKSAMESGILSGGGTSFVHGIKILEERLKEYKNDEKFFKEKHKINYDSIIGIRVFIQALKVNIVKCLKILLFLFYFNSFLNT